MKIIQVRQMFIWALAFVIFPVQVIPVNQAAIREVKAKPNSLLDSDPVVTLRAASGSWVEFRPNNGQPLDDIPPQILNLPHLVLFRNSNLTAPVERTLIISVSNLEVPSPGVMVSLAIETQHGDPDQDNIDGSRIPVLHASKWISNPESVTQTGVTVTFVHEFNSNVFSGTKNISTPTDYFRYDLVITENDHPVTNPLHTISGEYAFLMENQWLTSLPEVREETVGAAPDELILYYCDMFPFQNDNQDRSSWVPRETVRDYVESELGPAMVAAFRQQTDYWGFVWHQAWTSYRPGEDAERLSVALTDGRTWYHGKAPAMGHAGISLKVKAGQYFTRAGYDSLTDKLISVFQHELFHNLQRSIELHNGGNGDLDGKESAWRFFSEGTAVLASSVGKPDIQFAESNESLKNMFNASNFPLQHLNNINTVTDPNHAALYWRFLYEQCGGMNNGVEDPTAGMQIIRQILNVLYSKEVLDIHTSSDLTVGLPAIMDQALNGAACPFYNYIESLQAFSDAITALQLQDTN